MATGHSAFHGDTSAERISSILRDQPTSVIDLRAELPHHLGRVIRRCLEKDPDRRYQAALDVRNELEDLGTELALKAARPVSEPGRDPARPVVDRRPIHRAGLAALVIAVVAAGYLGWQLFGDRSSIAGDDRAGEVADAAGATTESRRLAVLPFANLRQDPETDFLGYALADQVINRLEYLSHILVRPSSAVRQYQGQSIQPAIVADELQVDYLLTGNYLKEGDSLRLNLELVNARSNESIWREPIEVRYENVFALQDLVTEKVTDGLVVRLSGEELRRVAVDISRDPLAYEYYLRAVSYPNNAEGHQLATEMLRRSVELDPDYPSAFQELGNRLHQLAVYTTPAEEDALREEAMQAVQRALELNPEHLQALSLLSTFYTELGPLEKAFDLSLRALEVNPNSPYLHFSLGYAYRYAGLLEESAREYERAISLDPANRRWRSAGITHLQLGNYEDALRGFDLDAESSWSMFWKGLVFLAMERPDDALEQFEKGMEIEGDGSLADWALAPTGLIEGNLEEGLAAARRAEDLALADGESHRYNAVNYCMLGEQAGCLRELEAALERGYFNYQHLVTDPVFDLVRETERFQRVLAASKEQYDAIKARYGSSDPQN